MNILGICILASVVILVTGAVYVTKMVMEAKAKIAALENSIEAQIFLNDFMICTDYSWVKFCTYIHILWEIIGLW